MNATPGSTAKIAPQHAAGPVARQNAVRRIRVHFGWFGASMSSVCGSQGSPSVTILPGLPNGGRTTDCGLVKQTPAYRTVQRKPSACANVIALPWVGGPHHRYQWRDAA
jgi:hypothetical protein